MKNLQLVSGSVVETDHPFLALWPHRFDYIWAEHPAFDEKPKWQTETRHPLSDRLILQGAYLYGVRFGPTTQYIMLDIDRGSIYHPAKDSLAISRIRSALEDIGLTDGVFCTSSYSGGLHLYFPFEEAQKTWQVAIAITTLLENKGFKFAPGHLEIFPNSRHYCPNGERTLYHAHRLPLQTGSYLLDSQLEPVSSSPDRFVELWHYAAARNSLTSKTVSRILKAAQRQQYRVTAKAEKFLNDLNAEIEMGWTGPGMTNRLLGRIAMRSYVFGHILYASQPLTSEALVEDIVRHARALPGFYEWSNHVEELEEKALQWARSVEKSHYFHYGSGKALKPQSAA
ncbi:MAG: hypothetical protein LPK03_11920, partial [Pontibacter sp.]|nr:hypothetical protein [Pontibacter sp.]